MEEVRFGPLIKSCRENRRWSLRKVAREAGGGIHATTVRMYEMETCIPRLDKAASIAKVFNLSLDEVMGIKVV